MLPRMNWTEGTLARHSRRKGWNADAARQKEYFAKASARHQQHSSGLTRPPSFVPSYIPAANIQPARHHELPRQRLVHLSDAASNRSFTAHQSLGNVGEHQDALLPDPLVVNMEAKRQRLLERSDWTGIDLQKPSAVDFSGFSWSIEHVPKGVYSEHPADQTPHIAARQRRDRSSISDDTSNTDMRIEIGSQRFRWSKDSNSLRSPVSSRHFHTSSYTGPSESSSPSYRHAPASSLSNYSFSPSLESKGSRKGRPIAHQGGEKLAGKARYELGTAHTPPNESERPSLGGEPEPMIVSSPPAAIQQPKPRRVIPILQRSWSPYSELAGSTLAQPEAPEKPGNTTGEDIRWSTWLEQKSNASVQGQQEYPDSSTDDSNLTNLKNQTPRKGTSVSRYGGSTARFCISNSSSKPAWHRDTNLHQPQSPGRTSLAVLQQPLHEAIHGSCWPQPRGDTAAMNQTHSTQIDLAAGVYPDQSEAMEEKECQDIPKTDNDHLGHSSQHDVTGGSSQAEDQDAIWRKFIEYDDSQDMLLRAQQEAQEQTKRELRQSFASIVDGFANSRSANAIDVPWTNPPDSVSGPSHGGCSLETNQYQASTDATTMASILGDGVNDVGSVVAKPRTPSPRACRGDFKFHQPQLFVGRLAHEVPTNLAPELNSRNGKAKRRCRKRPRDNGRPDIRSMPDFAGDPIEESP
ncbi:hypothetical protein B0I35DRAFT_119111 [Stachybotrys elegans]|uniref:Uncharacterized protein n=1 Tax=Stachybotrys elegans TaxID=80388 RepID=A0A8K0SXY8_9HYPO|nr:hypothetical protein B0I35DRAFT_119111 [Stachybotrys elegans]